MPELTEGQKRYRKYKKQLKKYREKNKAYTKKYGKKLRDRQRFGGNRIKALKRDEYTCQRCGMTDQEHIEKWGRSITVDHIDGKGRYSKVKNHSLENLLTLCLRCHGKKDNRYSSRKKD